ncbi:very short patch repair endonuclease [Parendozoicomonas sp. Alg238-R29]|uniref:very short patch repair endonuclease n=1 Tax=Parendozoicomonas sp. Alg238-R29 TaxID=2993446 RepID=UPI00248DBA63|nr:very short patch repair endonuclease [Parendozoicomonas sp. Alg238-R29]
MDNLSSQTRSHIMASIHSKDTKPEILVRKALYSLGFRYRCHYKNLPGKPDIVLPKYRAIIQVNGCFWHGHDCHIFKMPKSRTEFWENKISRNQIRDEANHYQVTLSGWRNLVIWECALQGKEKQDFDWLIGEVVRWILVGGSSLELRGKGKPTL